MIALFHYILNNLHDDINFTLEYDQKEQPFLDVMVRNKAGKIENRHFLQGNRQQTVSPVFFMSPRHTKLNIPYNLVRILKQLFPNKMPSLVE